MFHHFICLCVRDLISVAILLWCTHEPIIGYNSEPARKFLSGTSKPIDIVGDSLTKIAPYPSSDSGDVLGLSIQLHDIGYHCKTSTYIIVGTSCMRGLRVWLESKMVAELEGNRKVLIKN